MIVIRDIEISSFRSIISLKVHFDNSSNIITICGENNVGKTNFLRAVNLFFNPQYYDHTVDRPILKQAQGGARIDTKIIIHFCDIDQDEVYCITRDFKFSNSEEQSLTGQKYFEANKSKKTPIKKYDIESFLKKIKFCFIESININTPELVENLTEDVIDVEYGKTKFTENKNKLREAFTNYTTGLQEILDVFSNSISSTFNLFKDNWDVKFNVPSSIDTFRDLISNDVELLIDDKGCLNVEQKGSGLQRLAVILLHFEIMKRMKKINNFIVCIDEPDIYLHDGLQYKLLEFIKEKSHSNFQIFYTTHSNIFINSYSMKNVTLLGAEHYSQYSSRKKKEISVVKTKVFDTSSDDGYDKICQHLGIEKNNYEMLDRHNLLVEGGCDKKYIEELASYFEIQIPKIIPMNGVTNVSKNLEFYNGFYKDNTSKYTPVIKVLFDNDIAGRNEYRKVKSNKYDYIKVRPILLCNHQILLKDVQETTNINHEIEDFVYPETICYLINAILRKKEYNLIREASILSKIAKKSFSQQGIFSVIEHEKNDKNPDMTDFSLISSNRSSNNLKNGLAEIFTLKGDRRLISLVEEATQKHPNVKNNLIELLSF